MIRHAKALWVFLAALFLPGCRLADRLRDWDWNLLSLWHYAADAAAFHVSRLGWMGYVLVPLSIWALLLLFRPTRYIVSLVTIDMYRHTLSHVFASVFQLLTGAVLWLWGQVIARFRGAFAWFSNRLK